MAKVKGVCRNYDNCDMAADKVIQEVEKANFVCEECGKPLYPVADKGKTTNPNQKRWIILTSLIIGVLLVIGGIICGIVLGVKSSRQKAERQRLEAIEQARMDSIAKVEADSIAAVKLAEEQAAEAERLAAIEQKRLDSIAKVEADSLAAIQLAEAEAAEAARLAAEAARLADEQTKSAKKQSVASGSVDYGKWSGAWKNGKPNGTGTMRYTKDHLIDTRDPQKRMAVKGDYIIGEFANGRLVQGVWYDSANNVKGSIIIGM